MLCWENIVLVIYVPRPNKKERRSKAQLNPSHPEPAMAHTLTPNFRLPPSAKSHFDTDWTDTIGVIENRWCLFLCRKALHTCHQLCGFTITICAPKVMNPQPVQIKTLGGVIVHNVLNFKTLYTNTIHPRIKIHYVRL